MEEDILRYYGGLDMMLAKEGDGPWAVGDAMTVADVVVRVRARVASAT